MENSMHNGNTQYTRPETASAQAESRPATTPAQTAAQKPPERAPEQVKEETGQTSAPKQATGAETAGERKRIDPIALAEEKLKQKEAKLAEKRNLLTQRKRKMRNGQLYVWGAMVESAYRHGDAGQRATLRKLAATYLTDERHRERSGFGFSRIDDERTESKT